MREMYPNEPTPEQNPYDFILNPQQRRPGIKLFGVKDPFVAKLLLIVIGVAIGVVVIGVVLASVAGKSSVNIPALVGVAQSQQELARLAQQGAANGTQPVTRYFAINLQLSMESEQLQLLAYLKTQGTKPSTAALSLKRSKATDTQLTNALQSSTFDSVFVQLMQNSLVSYNTELEQVASTATGVNEKKILAADITYANMLLQQVPTQESLQNGS